MTHHRAGYSASPTNVPLPEQHRAFRWDMARAGNQPLWTTPPSAVQQTRRVVLQTHPHHVWVFTWHVGERRLPVWWIVGRQIPG